MDSLNLSFWLGISLAIPFAILANLLTPLFARQWAKRSSKRANQLAKGLRQELEDIGKLAADSNKHQVFLLESVLLITFLSAAFGAAIGLSYSVSAMLGHSPLFAAVGQGLATVGGVMVAIECINTLRKSARIRKFEEYKVRVLNQLKELHNSGAD